MWTGGAFARPGAEKPYAFALSLYAYEGPVREGIRAAKYAGRSGAAAPFAEALAEAIRGPWSGWFPDGRRPTIVPVPLRPRKYLRRGYNLPSLVGAALAKRTGWPFAPALLRRTGGDRPQAGLPLRDRRENVREAFSAAPGAGMPREILLLDDVLTSGATAESCARALKTAGAEHIVVLTVARTVL
ncbi:MAG: ComF family protein [Deltaproteobacteria bacterium]|nr:ComF family protein [Deltaproteobacteria bacterium]